MIWGIFSAQGVGLLVEINGNMSATFYKDTLENYLLSYVEETMLQNWRFQQDNDPKHTSKLLKQWFSASNVRLLSWSINHQLEPKRTFMGNARLSSLKA